MSFCFTYIETSAFFSLNDLNSPIDIVIVRIAYFERFHVAGPTLADDSSFKTQFLRMQIYNRFNTRALQFHWDWFYLKVDCSKEFQRKQDLKLLNFSGNESYFQKCLNIWYEFKYLLAKLPFFLFILLPSCLLFQLNFSFTKLILIFDFNNLSNLY